LLPDDNWWFADRRFTTLSGNWQLEEQTFNV